MEVFWLLKIWRGSLQKGEEADRRNEASLESVSLKMHDKL